MQFVINEMVIPEGELPQVRRYPLPPVSTREAAETLIDDLRWKHDNVDILRHLSYSLLLEQVNEEGNLVHTVFWIAETK